MNLKTSALVLLLCYGVLTLWVEELWAWSLFQVGVLVLAGWHAVRTRFRFCMGLAWAALACAAASPLVQLATRVTVCPSQTLEAALNWFTFFVVFAFSADVLQDIRQRGGFLRVLSIFGMALGTVATIQTYSSGGKYFWLFPSGFREDVLGPFANHGQFAAWLELLLPVALYLAATDRRVRALHGSSAAVMFGAIVASASRAGFALACAEVVAVIALFTTARTIQPKALTRRSLQFIAVALVAATVAGWHGLHGRLANSGPEALRRDAFRASIQMVKERPWAGTGLGTWATVYPRYAGFDSGLYMNQAHNDWAQWAAEGGIPFVCFLLLFGALLCTPALRTIYGLGTIAFLLHAVVDYPMQQRPGLAAWFFAFAGATFAWRNSAAGNRDGLLRRTRHRSIRFDSGNQERLQKTGAALAPGSLPGRGDADCGRAPDEAPERDYWRVE